MGHIHTEPGQHDQTISAFIVREDFDKPKLLLHMHKKLHVLLQPGGHIELNETPWQAISHEVAEETGYRMDQLQILQPAERLKAISGAVLHPTPLVYNTHYFDTEGTHRHTDVSYAFVANGEPALELSEDESSDVRWLSLEELMALNPNEIFENVREIGAYTLSTVLNAWERVDTAEYKG